MVLALQKNKYKNKKMPQSVISTLCQDMSACLFFFSKNLPFNNVFLDINSPTFFVPSFVLFACLVRYRIHKVAKAK